MKSPTPWRVNLYQPDSESAIWRLLLRVLGVEATLIRDENGLSEALLQSDPGLFIFDRALLGEAFPVLGTSCFRWLDQGGGVALTGTEGLWPIPANFLSRAIDIADRDPFAINILMQNFVSSYSRLYPRLETRLPGLYARGAGKVQICEIMNLSPGGAFIRTTEALPASGEELQLCVPLIGLRKEIEISSRVVRQVLPNELNNYSQGIGVRFIADKNSSAFTELNNYVRYVIAHDDALLPRINPFFACRSKRDESNGSSSQKSISKGRERTLMTNR